MTQGDDTFDPRKPPPEMDVGPLDKLILSGDDPFAVGKIGYAPRRLPVAMPAFDRMSREDHARIRDLSQRIGSVLREHASPRSEIPSDGVIACDISVAHLQYGLDIAAFHRADNLAAVAEYITIARTIDRRVMRLSTDRDLKFLATGSRLLRFFAGGARI